MGPNALLSTLIFQSPLKFGLSAAVANAAIATIRTRIVRIVFIARKLLRESLLLFEHVGQVELLTLYGNLVIDGERLAIAREIVHLVELQLIALEFADALDHELAVLPHCLALGLALRQLVHGFLAVGGVFQFAGDVALR